MAVLLGVIDFRVGGRLVGAGDALRKAVVPLRIAWQAASIAPALLLLAAPLSSSTAMAAADRVDRAVVDDEAEASIFALMDLEELMQVRVTSVAGVGTGWLQTPAAIEVLTAEEIRRSGLRSIPELLRMVPGMHVARLDSGQWAISARGFSGEFANKLQVLMDGRRLYDPLFSGVYWDVADTVIEDIDRIEVIRGPGATLWGANAVNGVINITSRTAKETQGLLVSGGGGTFERSFASARYGGRIDDETHYRVYGKYRNFDSTPSVDAGERPDDWEMWQAGFRFDHGNADEAILTVQGDAFRMPNRGTRLLVPDPTTTLGFMSETSFDRATGGNLLARLHRDIDRDSHWTLQVYYDRLERKSSGGFDYERNSIDADFRHHFHLGERHAIVWGASMRHDRLDSTATPTFFMSPAARNATTFAGFIQDTVTLVPDRLFAMVGSKVEHNDFSGFEVQPSARVWWTPNDRQTLWGAFSRPVRTPSWVEQDIAFTTAFVDPGLLGDPPIPTGTTVPIVLNGNPNVNAETVLAWEAGYRHRLTDTLTVDIAGFYSRYSDLIDLTGLTFGNVGSADVGGIEVAAKWRVAPNWLLTGSYSYLDIVAGDTASREIWEGSSPRHQFQLQSRLDITKDLEFNSALYFVDRLRGQDVSEYFRLDLGVTWRPRHNVELSVWGQNLIEKDHVEFDSQVLPFDSPGMVERSIAVQATVRF